MVTFDRACRPLAVARQEERKSSIRLYAADGHDLVVSHRFKLDHTARQRPAALENNLARDRMSRRQRLTRTAAAARTNQQSGGQQQQRTKAQRDAKKANEELLTKVASGDILPNDIQKHQHDIEVQRVTIDETDMPNGYNSEADVIAKMS